MSSKIDLMDALDEMFPTKSEENADQTTEMVEDLNICFKVDSEHGQDTDEDDMFQEFRSLGGTKPEDAGTPSELYVSNVSYKTPPLNDILEVQGWNASYKKGDKRYTMYISKGRFIIKSDYDKEWVRRFRLIPGKEWDDEKKEWSFPMSSFKKFRELFSEFKIPDFMDREYNRLVDPKNNMMELPEMNTFNGVLYPFQKYGVRFLVTGRKVLLCDEMGLGKTIEGIAASCALLESGVVEKIMVFCPSDLKYQWEKEILKFTDRTTVRIVGTRKQREKIWATVRKADYILLNYELAINDLDNKMILHCLNRWNFAIILDEATRIKNWRSKTTKAFSEFQSPVKFMLTGTPVENHPAELFTLSRFLDSNMLGSWEKFNKRYIYRNEQGWILGYRNLEELHQRILPLMLRRKKEKVLPELPDKIINEYFIEMSAAEKRDYNAIKKIVLDYLKRTEKAQDDGNKSEFDLNQKALFHSIQFCKMYCDHPDLVRRSKSDLIKGLELTATKSSKLEELKFLVEDIVSSGNKVVIFTEFVRAAEVISDSIPGVVVYRGGLSEKEKNERISRFVNDPECMILCSTNAGSHGLNLQEASSYLINFDLPWNPSVLNQRIDRVHRIGQSNTVNIINMIISDNEVIEKEVMRVLKRKQIMFNKVIDGR